MRFSIALLAAALAAPATLAETHRWFWKQRPASATVMAAAAEMEKLLDASGAASGIPRAIREATLAWIAIGYQPRSNEDGQLFLFPGLENANQCRTHSPEYDVLVIAALLVARDHFD